MPSPCTVLYNDSGFYNSVTVTNVIVVFFSLAVTDDTRVKALCCMLAPSEMIPMVSLH